MEKYILIAVLLGLAIKVESRSTGAPAGACTTLSPEPTAHNAEPQSSTVPYEVDLSAFYYSGGYYYYPGQTYLCKSCNQ